MFPPIMLHAEDTVKEIETRLIRAILDNSKKPGIKPIYTSLAVKQEAIRLYAVRQDNLNM